MPDPTSVCYARDPPTQLIPFLSDLKALHLSTQFYDTFDCHLRLEPHPNVRSLRIDIVPDQSICAIGPQLHGDVDGMWIQTLSDVIDGPHFSSIPQRKSYKNF
jgi:hypothetical protein